MGNESMAALSSKVLNRELRVEILDVDRHRRIVAMLWLGNRNINLEMVKEGYAEAYREYLKDPYRQIFGCRRGGKSCQKGDMGIGNVRETECLQGKDSTGVN